MAIMGGAVLPKLMGDVADRSDISRAFVVPIEGAVPRRQGVRQGTPAPVSRLTFAWGTGRMSG
jgi:hypothetical protein